MMMTTMMLGRERRRDDDDDGRERGGDAIVGDLTTTRCAARCGGVLSSRGLRTLDVRSVVRLSDTVLIASSLTVATRHRTLNSRARVSRGTEHEEMDDV